MIGMDSILWMAIAWLGLAVACALVARWKNLNAFYWFGRGLIFGVFSLIHLFLTPGE